MAVRTTGDDDLRAEINVTPLVDVVLVLLVIFMVVTPLLKQDVPVELPLAEHSRTAEDASQVTVTLAADGRASIDGDEVPRADLVPRLTALYAERPDKTVFLEADRGLSHGQVVDLMDDCRAAGIIRIGVVTTKGPVHGPGSAARNDAAAGAGSPAPPALAAPVPPVQESTPER